MRADFASTNVVPRPLLSRDFFRRNLHERPVEDAQRRHHLALYARFGLPEFWVIDVNSRRLYLHRQPSESTYLEISTLDAPSSMLIERLPGVALDLSWLSGD
jgi:Uma2 family endonuclease